MGIYNTDDELDLVEAAAEIATARGRSNRADSEFALKRISAAALLDIAGSLRTLAHESALAIGGAFELDTPEPADEPGETLPDVRPEDAPAASRVRWEAAGAASSLGTLTGETGIDQGDAWVTVKWDDAPLGETAYRVWAADLEVVRRPEPKPPTLAEIRESDAPLVGVATEAESPALRTDADEDADEAVGGYELDEPANTVADPDDLDGDFDGDEHPAAVDALAALKAREKAARAAKAKKGKKP